jgi:integrase
MLPIYRREKVEGKGWRYVRVNFGPGRPPAEAPPYHVRYMEDGRQRWSNALDTVAAAQAFADGLPSVLEAKSKKMTLRELNLSKGTTKKILRVAVSELLDKAARNRTPGTLWAYENALKDNPTSKRKRVQSFLQFAEREKVQFVEDITVDTLRKYQAMLFAAGLGKVTVNHRFQVLTLLLKRNNSKVRLPNDEQPPIEKKPPKPFTKTEIAKLWAEMTDEDKIRFDFFLNTGCRFREVKYASWDDLDLDGGTFTVSGKPDIGFTVKDHEDRTIGIPSTLVAALRAYKKKAPHARWLFVNGYGGPVNDYLHRLKEIALAADVNCGHCKVTLTRDGKSKEVTCNTHPVCERFKLHRLRKTCATRWSKNGVDLMTIKSWLGHSSLNTTQIYLGVTPTSALRRQIDAAASGD